MESNKLIAEFMDMELEHDKVWLNEIFHKDLIRGRDYYEYANTKNVEYDGLSWNSVLVEIEYHSSWEWLMLVVDRINNTCDGYGNHYDFQIGNGYVWVDPHIGDRIFFSGNDINYKDESMRSKVYRGVVEFIKWYNKKQ